MIEALDRIEAGGEFFDAPGYVRVAPPLVPVPSGERVTPQEAWRLFSSGAARLVDVRSIEERQFVGHVPDSIHVAWANGTSLTRNPRFLRELEAKTGKEALLLLLCRSGTRAEAAAQAARAAGFTQVYSVSEGFEGDLDENRQRGHRGGWRAARLPWVQG